MEKKLHIKQNKQKQTNKQLKQDNKQNKRYEEDVVFKCQRF